MFTEAGDGMTVEKNVDVLFNDRTVVGRPLNKDELLQPDKTENLPVRTYIQESMTLVLWRRAILTNG